MDDVARRDLQRHVCNSAFKLKAAGFTDIRVPSLTHEQQNCKEAGCHSNLMERVQDRALEIRSPPRALQGHIQDDCHRPMTLSVSATSRNFAYQRVGLPGKLVAPAAQWDASGHLLRASRPLQQLICFGGAAGCEQAGCSTGSVALQQLGACEQLRVLERLGLSEQLPLVPAGVERLAHHAERRRRHSSLTLRRGRERRRAHR